jgi:hypothetical protein
MKSFIVPRDISVNPGGTTTLEATKFKVEAKARADTYGIYSNPFFNKEFKSINYAIEIEQLGDDSFYYDEDTQVLIKGMPEVFHHTEKNIMKSVK